MSPYQQYQAWIFFRLLKFNCLSWKHTARIKFHSISILIKPQQTCKIYFSTREYSLLWRHPFRLLPSLNKKKNSVGSRISTSSWDCRWVGLWKGGRSMTTGMSNRACFSFTVDIQSNKKSCWLNNTCFEQQMSTINQFNTIIFKWYI